MLYECRNLMYETPSVMLLQPGMSSQILFEVFQILAAKNKIPAAKNKTLAAGNKTLAAEICNPCVWLSFGYMKSFS